MLDLKFIRENTDRVRQAAEAKGMSVDIDGIIAADDRRHTLIQEGEALKARRNQVSAQVGKVKKVGGDAGSLIREMESVKDRIQAIDAEMKEVEKSLNGLMLSVPNIPHASVPLGNTPQENKEVFAWGEKPVSEEPMRPHWELTEKLGIIDFTRGAKVAGAGFPFYVGKGAVLERALINFFLDKAAEHGYRELWTPIVVNEESARGTGQLPDKEDLMYVAERDGLFLIPTAEVPVSNFHRDESFQEKDLPVRYAAYTPCFRREAGSYGKDVRGLNRLHQFDKVELVKFVHPETSYDELDSLRADAERLLQLLGLPYRVLLMCTGDMGFTQSKKFDLEVWAPGQQRWLEVSSCSNFESFQARRMNIRFKPKAGGKPEFVHTLNGSALALPRVVAALIEHYQTPEGKIIVPKALHRYTGFEVIG
ncbi:MAG: serine--tRNA ligase [Ignavibacteria bacterium GWA2_55_11]|nr:MAG: serine--tRNA ligase [Ignavibacteria bacterium GWA2_55_11]OGU44102.1 MAG: serine--tRNA ligase [Ignavibacteria bacterium GWC2_56_12]OGU75516.1 MAG: serine--tRNA ligase [Ignavibacteria bacterium RIFCSPLOWO2_12_FULL_56_21]